jgi:hypothetical protein
MYNLIDDKFRIAFRATPLDIKGSISPLGWKIVRTDEAKPIGTCIKKYVNIDNDINIDVFYDTFKLSNIFKDFVNELNKSKYILELNDNWDNEGSKGYKQNTWMTMATFLIKAAQKLYDQGIIIDTPRISNGPDGSIDLYWKKRDYYLLINIPNDINEQSTYFGEDASKNSMQGAFDTKNIEKQSILWVFYMLMNR